MQAAFADNLDILARRFPTLAAAVQAVDIARLEVRPTPDGGVVYYQEQDGRKMPITSPTAPMAAVERRWAEQQAGLEHSQNPALVLGLAPGLEVARLHAFLRDWRERCGARRQLYVIVADPVRLACWLLAADRRQILADDQVEFYLHDGLHELTARLDADPERHYHFLAFATLPDSEAGDLLAPLTEWYLDREQQLEQLAAANEAHYAAITDADLARTLRGEGERPPRLLMPATRHSTVLQYSSRDTAAACRAAGWETRLLEADGEVSRWRFTKAIAEFKPDLFLFIDHLRTEGLRCFPRDLLFVTWLQDSMPAVNDRHMATQWEQLAADRRRDLIVGAVDELPRRGYPAERLAPLPMIVDRQRFRPYPLSAADRERFGCRVCFASNRSTDTRHLAADLLPPILGRYGFDINLLLRVETALREYYAGGRTIVNLLQMTRFLERLPGAGQRLAELGEAAREFVVERLFWHLNDLVYRHTVLDWLIGFGVDLHLYGSGWDKHPRFKDYARGPLAHGEELSRALQAADFCLHLNASEGNHQRLWEILASGGRPLVRQSPAAEGLEAPLRRAFAALLHGAAPPDHGAREALADWCYDVATQAGEEPGAAPILRRLRRTMTALGNRLLPPRHLSTFASRGELGALLALRRRHRPSVPPPAPDVPAMLGESLARLLEPAAEDRLQQVLLHDWHLDIDRLRTLVHGLDARDAAAVTKLWDRLDAAGPRLHARVGLCLHDAGHAEAAGRLVGQDLVQAVTWPRARHTAAAERQFEELPEVERVLWLRRALDAGCLEFAGRVWDPAEFHGRDPRTAGAVLRLLNDDGLHGLAGALYERWAENPDRADLLSIDGWRARLLARIDSWQLDDAIATLAAADQDGWPWVFQYRFWLLFQADRRQEMATEVSWFRNEPEIFPALHHLYQALYASRCEDLDEVGASLDAWLATAPPAHPWWTALAAALYRQIGQPGRAAKLLRAGYLDHPGADVKLAAMVQRRWRNNRWPGDLAPALVAMHFGHLAPCSFRYQSMLQTLENGAVGTVYATPAADWRSHQAETCRRCRFRTLQCLWTTTQPPCTAGATVNCAASPPACAPDAPGGSISPAPTGR